MTEPQKQPGVRITFRLSRQLREYLEAITEGPRDLSSTIKRILDDHRIQHPLKSVRSKDAS